jgi:hypothetical protein
MTVIYVDRRNPKSRIVHEVLSGDWRTSAEIAARLPRPPFRPVEDVSPHLARLVKSGLVEREEGSKPARYRKIDPSTSGRSPG